MTAYETLLKESAQSPTPAEMLGPRVEKRCKVQRVTDDFIIECDELAGHEGKHRFEFWWD